MLLNEHQFETFLNAVGFNIMLSRDNFLDYIRNGIKIEQWPDKARIKGIVTEFLYHAEKDGWIFSQQMLFVQIEHLEKMDLPEDLEKVAAIYKLNLNYYRAKNLAFDIIKDPFDAQILIDKYLSNTTEANQSFVLDEILIKTLETNQKLLDEKLSKVILPDFPLLSNCAGGFNGGRISLLSAVSGFGKTKIAVNISLSAAKIMPVLYFNLEMSEADFSALYLQAGCMISGKSWSEGHYQNEVDLKNILEFKSDLEKRNSIHVLSGRSLSMNEIEGAAYAKLKNEKISMIIIDYDQKLDTSGFDSEWYGMLKIIERLEKLAFKLNAHILILTQANEEGNVKSSQRALQPASLAFHFTKTATEKFILQCKKNRFGPNNFEIEVEYFPEYSLVREKDFFYKETETKDLISMNKNKLQSRK